MLFRYDFGETLDITKFRMQAQHYIAQMRQLEYNLFLQNYKIIVNISTPDGSTAHLVSVSIYHIDRDENGEITSTEKLFPGNDLRFKEFKIIKEIWGNPDYSLGDWASGSVSNTTEKIISLLKIAHKIDNLKAFL